MYFLFIRFIKNWIAIFRLLFAIISLFKTLVVAILQVFFHALLAIVRLIGGKKQ